MTDENNIFTARFLGFSVYVSNTTSKEDGVLCFRDTIYTSTTIPNQRTSSVSHMEDMSFITTTELAFYIHQIIVSMHTRNYVKFKYTVN